MEWISLASTALGAGIGIGSTLLVDRVRWRRERAGHDLDVRRQMYADYTAALSRIRTALNECAQEDIPAAERPRRVREVFLTPGAYEIRHQLTIVAPPEIVEAARSGLEGRFDAAVAELRTVMRLDLGAAKSITAR
ncbi:hypothetical protein ACFCZ5_06330 [Streptomyces microflavus]|uniref:hypothetical protein n=1 Tax=Streptomyces microflavus TaxID=1919 RepID=UPI0035D54AE7